MKLTKKQKFDDRVWEVLFNHKALSKINMASILCDVMIKLRLYSLRRIGDCTYKKTKEWAEVCESTKRYFVKMVEDSTGTFLDREFKRARDCRKKKWKN